MSPRTDATNSEIRPQPGPQEEFLASSADIVLYGGGAGGGKSFGLILEGTRHVDNPDFGAVIFRRTIPQVTNEGGLWDDSGKVYPLLGATPNQNDHTWRFPTGATVSFSHLQHEKTKYEWQGSQIPLIGFDELTHFTKGQFIYMLSRNRSTCGVRPYVRATCNPTHRRDKIGGWVRDLIDWWIDKVTGLPIKDRAGVIRWFLVFKDKFEWADSREALIERFRGKIPDADLERAPKSFTFIPATVYDNKILLEKDPGYVANLLALSQVEREQLLNGNWNAAPTAGSLFKREWFQVVDAPPVNVQRRIRYWDRAATEQTENNDPDATAGVRMSWGVDGYFYVEHMVKMRERPLAVEDAILNTASQDGRTCEVGLFQDPGSAGVGEADHMVRLLAGYIVNVNRPPTRSINDASGKITAAKALSAQAERKMVRVVKGEWNDDWFDAMEGFPELDHDDEVDATTGAFNTLTGEFATDLAFNAVMARMV